MHHGPAVERDCDFFGAAVNLAARVSAAATGGEVLLTAQTAALAPDLDGILYEARGRQALRNVSEPVELVAAVRHGHPAAHRLAVDPVCRMVVDPRHAAGRLVYEDTAYFFCSLTCAGESSPPVPSATRPPAASIAPRPQLATANVILRLWAEASGGLGGAGASATRR